MNKQHIAQSNIRIQTIINFIAGATFLIPIITLFYKHTGLGLIEIVIISNVATIAIGILEIPTSVLADTIGRKFSLQCSVLSNCLGAFVIFIFPSYTGFIVAALLSALYWSFWSGTGQAFLAENLTILKRSNDFGKVIGGFMFYEQLAMLCTPFFAAILLFTFGDTGFRILAFLDVIFSLLLVIFVFRLHEIKSSKQKNSGVNLIRENFYTAKIALNNVFHNSRLRLLLLYRSLANHVAYFPLIILPILSESGMPDWFSGVVTAIAAIGGMLSSKYAYLIGERIGYRSSWLVGTIFQAVLLIISGFLISKWILLVFIFFLFNIGEGIWQPSWNHVLVKETGGKAIATTRSVIFATFAIYTTIGKQILAIFPLNYSLIGMGIFILLVNISIGKKLLRM